jgi:hypothetical protein
MRMMQISGMISWFEIVVPWMQTALKPPTTDQSTRAVFQKVLKLH